MQQIWKQTSKRETIVQRFLEKISRSGLGLGYFLQKYMYHDMLDLKTHRNYEYLELTIHQSKIIRVSTKHCRLQRV